MSKRRRALGAVSVIFWLIVATPAGAELGTVDFPTSARSPEAQSHFLRGVLLLHSFTFELAEAAFREASHAEPDFVMAYWGEALSHNHPLIAERDADLPRAVLKRLAPTRAARAAKAKTEREKGLLGAVETLFSEGGEKERSLAYAEAMGELAAGYPDDHEIQAFYAVALLGTVRLTEDKDFRTRVRAGAIAENIFRENPNHPGAAHYVIHSFDDPVHAPLALRAAYRYADIAPDSAHALHMPSHIFIQHGMWDRVVASNQASYDSAIRLWQKRDGLSDTQKYYNDIYVWHALDWGQYGSLQLGRYEEAKQAIERLRPVAEKSEVAPTVNGLAEMYARYIVESEAWEVLPIDDAIAPQIFASGMSAARMGNLEAAAAAERKLSRLVAEHSGEALEKKNLPLAIQAAEIGALVALAKGNGDEAIARMDEAVALSGQMDAPRGAAKPIKPAHELYGEILLELGRADAAATHFETCLQLMPKRALSLRGLARATEQLAAVGR